MFHFSILCFRKLAFFTFFFIFSCDTGSVKKTDIIQEVESLQKSVNCVVLSERKLNYNKEISDIIISEKHSHIERSFTFIILYIENMTDELKKKDLEGIFYKFANDISELGQSALRKADAPSVFEHLFFDYPQLTQALTKALQLDQTVYDFYYDLDVIFSSGSNYKKYNSALKHNFNQLSSNEQKFVLSLKKNLLTELKILKQHECFCVLTATEFVNSSECSELKSKATVL